MAIMRITCPECGAGLKSADGFTVGQEVECPKCATEFEVEKPVAAKTTALAPSKTRALSKKTTKLGAGEDEDDDRPTKKKKKKKKTAEDEEEWSYKNSWIRYAVLGVLLIVLAVLGYMLYQKKQKEKENADKPAPDAGANAPAFAQGGGGLREAGTGGFNPKGGIKLSPLANPPSMQPGVVAVPMGGVNPNPGFNPPPALDSGIPFLGGSPAMSPQEKQQKQAALQAKLVGTWRADLGGGKTQTVTYAPDGKFTEAGAKPQTGTWRVSELLGTRGLVLARTGEPREVTAVFEGDEMIHDTAERGVSGVFRKK